MRSTGEKKCTPMKDEGSGQCAASPVTGRVEVFDAMAPFVGALDAYHNSTDPSTWLESMVKFYVGDGLAADFYTVLASSLAPEVATVVRDVLAETDHSQFVVEEVRRAVAATALSMAVTTVLDTVTMMALRQHLITPATVSGAGPAGNGDWVLGNWFTNPGGAQVSASTADHLYAQSQGGHAMITPQALNTWAAQNHYTQWWSYQPAARWWQLQLTEGAWLLAASLLLITATILLIRRRPA